MSTTAAHRRGTILQLLRNVWSEYQKDYARYFAAAMVYYALLSMVPLILLLLSTLGLLLRFSDVAVAVEQDVLRAIEAGLGTPVRVTIGELLQEVQRESVIATGISLGALLITASKLFQQLRLSFRAIWKYAPPLVSGTVRVAVLSTLLEKAMGFALLLIAGALLLFALALLATVQWLGGHLERLPWLGHIGWLVALPTTFAIAALTFVMLFRFLPPVRIRWRHIGIVATACALACMAATEILALYGTLFGSKFGAWGVVGGLLMIMLWMDVVSQILFYGAELCKVLSRGDWKPAETTRLNS
jgi:membrane protein